jgi:hypothetical protein
MPTEAPGTFKCKTWYPIWLNGKYNYSLYACMIISMCLFWEGGGYCSFVEFEAVAIGFTLHC